jgi:hypothetical protein
MDFEATLRAQLVPGKFVKAVTCLVNCSARPIAFGETVRLKAVSCHRFYLHMSQG